MDPLLIIVSDRSIMYQAFPRRGVIEADVCFVDEVPRVIGAGFVLGWCSHETAGLCRRKPKILC